MAKKKDKRKRDMEVEKYLNWWKKDILGCFIPKCSWCEKRATTQTTQGKYAQENNHRPVKNGTKNIGVVIKSLKNGTKNIKMKTKKQKLRDKIAKL